MSILPPELKAHRHRLSTESLEWLDSEFSNDKILEKMNLGKFSRKLLSRINQLSNELGLPIDAEIAYIAIKAGVMTGNLEEILSFDWEPRHPAIRAYQGLALIYMNDFSNAEKFLELARIEAESQQDIAVIGEIMGIQIYLANARYQFFVGVQVLQQALPLILDKKNTHLMPFFQWVRIAGAKSLMKLGNVQEAIYINNRAIDIAKITRDNFFRSYGLLGLGHCLDMASKTIEAIKKYQDALNFAKQIEAHNLLSIIYNRMGMAWSWRMDKLNKGLGYFEQAVVQADSGQAYWLREGPQWNLAALFRTKRDWTSAIKSIEDIIESARKVGESRTELIGYLNLAELLESEGNNSEANKVRETAESLASLLNIDIQEFFYAELDQDEIDNFIVDDQADDTSENNFREDYTQEKQTDIDDPNVSESSNTQKEIEFDEEEDFEENLRRFFKKRPL